MLLDSETVTNLRRVPSTQRVSVLARDPADAITLAGLFELAHAYRDGSWKEPNLAVGVWLAPDVRRMLLVVSRQIGGTADLFHGGKLIASKPGLRIDYLPDVGALEDNERAQRAEQLFVRASTPPLLPKKLMEAHARCLSEMICNVRDHSAASGANMPGALVGFHVTGGIAHYAVADLGRGVRQSLGDNPRWDGLNGDPEALLAVLKENASRKTSEGGGDGFRQVVKALVGLNGSLRLQSGEGVAIARNRAGEPLCQTAACPAVSGLRVSVSFSGGGSPTEQAISFI